IQYWKNKSATNYSSQDSGHSSTRSHAPGGSIRKKILALTNSYHGDTFGAMSVSERGAFTIAFQDYLFEVIFTDIDQPWSVKKEEWDEIACFIYEPLVQGAGGMKMYDEFALNALLAKCKQHNIICIADEVMTGFGRTGRLFASDYVAEKPDIICLSKGITGGMMALGATACTQDIYDAFLSDDRSKTFFHGHSYTANPLACAAANASLDLLLDNTCMENINRIGEKHAAFANHLLLNSSGNIKNIRHLGTILAFELETNGSDGYLNNISSVLHQNALEKGVLLRPLGNTLYVMPPYCITDEELEKVYQCTEEIIQ
ncbi:MAG TPA: aminotransferase class III-fold pyridoxal phosphate-dependent enzyme, partial [Chitinophagaceae bacterium]